MGRLSLAVRILKGSAESHLKSCTSKTLLVLEIFFFFIVRIKEALNKMMLHHLKVSFQGLVVYN